ncbi:MAG: hypothetical protein AAGF95_09620 [Chloroflexota bacterium]
MTTADDADRPREQLLEELAYLREFRTKVLEFLSILCNYDIKTPVISIRGYTDLMVQFPEFGHHPEIWLKVIQHSNREILDVLDTAISVARFERDPKQDLTIHPHSKIDIATIVNKHIVYVRQRLEEECDIRQSIDKNSQCTSNSPDEQEIIATKLVVNIPDNLPSIHGYKNIIDHIFALLIPIILKVRSKSEVRFSIEFDDQSISTTVGWVAKGSEGNLLEEDFNQFPSALTGFAFYGPSLGLYLSWRMAQQLGGQLHFAIRDQTTHLITLTLPRDKKYLSEKLD